MLTTAENLVSFCLMYRFSGRKLWYYSTRAIAEEEDKKQVWFCKNKSHVQLVLEKDVCM
jgi:hypothetical protein